MLIPIFGIQFHIFELIYLPIISALVLHTLFFQSHGQRIQINTNIFILFASLFLYTGAILLSSINSYSIPLVIKSFAKWVEVFVIALLTFIFITNTRRFVWIYRFLFLSVAIFVFVVLYRVASGELMLLGHRIFPGLESVFAFGLLLPFVKSKRPMWIYLLLTLFMFTTILSLARSAYLPIFIILLVGFNYFDVKTQRRVVYLAIILLAGLLINDITREYLSSRWDAFLFRPSVSNTERSNLIGIAWNAFIEQPITGIGSLNLGPYIRANNLSHLIVGSNIDTYQPHNVILQIAAEEGFLGLITFLLVLVSTFFLTRNALKRVKTDKRYVWGLVNFLIGVLSQILFGFITAQFRLFIGLFFGLMAAANKPLETKGNPIELP